MVKGVPTIRVMKEDIVALQIKGHTAPATRALLGGHLRGVRNIPSLRSVYRVRRVWRRYGLIGIAKKRGPCIPRAGRGLSGDLAKIIRQWCSCPDGKRRGTRLKRLQNFLAINPRVNRFVSCATLCKWLRRMGLTRKKGMRVALQQDPLKVSLFWARCQMLGVDPDLTVWFDESGIDTRDWQMMYGYADKGQRFDIIEKFGRGERIDCLASCDASRRGLFCVEFVHRGTVQ